VGVSIASSIKRLMKGKEEGGGGQSKEMPASLIGFKQTQTWAKHWALPICRMGVPREDSHRQYKRYDSQEQWRGTGICIKICCHQKKKRYTRIQPKMERIGEYISCIKKKLTGNRKRLFPGISGSKNYIFRPKGRLVPHYNVDRTWPHGRSLPHCILVIGHGLPHCNIGTVSTYPRSLRGPHH
jgi:hypothetical protein